MSLLRCILIGALGLAVLAAWRYGHETGCIALIFVPVVAFPIVIGLWQAAMFRRRILADATFVGGTLLHRFWRGGALAMLASMAIGLFTAFMLLLDLAMEPPGILYALAVDAVLILLLMATLDRLLRPALTPAARRIVVKSWAAWINAAFLVLAKVGYDFATLPPPLRQGGGYTTYQGPSSPAYCESLSAILALRGRLDGRLRVELEATGDSLTGLALWIVFLGLSAFGAFGFSRYMVELFDRARSGRNDV